MVASKFQASQVAQSSEVPLLQILAGAAGVHGKEGEGDDVLRLDPDAPEHLGERHVGPWAPIEKHVFYVREAAVINQREVHRFGSVQAPQLEHALARLVVVRNEDREALWDHVARARELAFSAHTLATRAEAVDFRHHGKHHHEARKDPKRLHIHVSFSCSSMSGGATCHGSGSYLWREERWVRHANGPAEDLAKDH